MNAGIANAIVVWTLSLAPPLPAQAFGNVVVFEVRRPDRRTSVAAKLNAHAIGDGGFGDRIGVRRIRNSSVISVLCRQVRQDIAGSCRLDGFQETGPLRPWLWEAVARRSNADTPVTRASV